MNDSKFSPGRRKLIKSAGATLALAAMGPLAMRSAFAASTLTVGVIYVGARNDFGYNQAQAEAAGIIKKMPGVKVIDEEKVPETIAVQKTMEAMIVQDGAKLIFATSFGYYNPHVLKMAEKYPDVRFAHCGGMWTDKDPKNVGSFFGYIDECEYLSGVIAAHVSKTKKLGIYRRETYPPGLAQYQFLYDGRTVG